MRIIEYNNLNINCLLFKNKYCVTFNPTTQAKFLLKKIVNTLWCNNLHVNLDKYI